MLLLQHDEVCGELLWVTQRAVLVLQKSTLLLEDLLAVHCSDAVLIISTSTRPLVIFIDVMMLIATWCSRLVLPIAQGRNVVVRYADCESSRRLELLQVQELPLPIPNDDCTGSRFLVH